MPSIFGIWTDSLDHLVHLLVAYGLALPIGWHRAREEHGAGLRTFPLVAIASCALVQTAISVFGPAAAGNASIIQGVVTGIGFIGAGAIIRQGDLTTGPPRPVSGLSASWGLRLVTAITTSALFWPWLTLRSLPCGGSPREADHRRNATSATFGLAVHGPHMLRFVALCMVVNAHLHATGVPDGRSTSNAGRCRDGVCCQ